MERTKQVELAASARQDAVLAARVERWEKWRTTVCLGVGMLVLILVTAASNVVWGALATVIVGLAGWFGFEALADEARGDRASLHERLHKPSKPCPLESSNLGCPLTDPYL
jgi:hypothetical protein